MPKEESTWGLIAHAFKYDMKPALLRGLWPALIISLIFTALTYPTHLMELSESERIWVAVYEILMALLESIILAPVVVAAFHSLPPVPLLTRHFKLVTIEFLRTLPWIIGYTLLLLIPGIIKTVQYIFVPFIVMDSKSYARGEVDALKNSITLTKGRLAALVFFYILAQVVILTISIGVPGWLGNKSEAFSVRNFALDIVFATVFGIILELAASIVFYSIYVQIVRKGDANELAL